MHIYKITFLKNQVLSVTEAEPETHFDGSVFYEQANGQLIFAIVKAKSKEAAEEIAKEIVDGIEKS
ncbi:hypothetical protein [Polluticoccus soli]|uniref:hypothetical protein n=1 Tax=Polluticoccus soli TaxID=3034150 RepID=UPI0023E16E53|nr:hypothetical protein [Flavipsychrobacter sp. JY13-12]